MEGIKSKILELLKKDNKLSSDDIVAALGVPAAEVAAAIKELEDAKIICGHTTLVDWDKTDREFVTALIEVRVTPQRGNGFDKIAERIYRLDEVKSVYLMSGGFDLTIIMEGKNIKEISYFVSDKLSPIDAVVSTATHFILKNYKDNGVIFEKAKQEDERMIVSP